MPFSDRPLQDCALSSRTLDPEATRSTHRLLDQVLAILWRLTQ
ncbi:MAG: hypothetical protein U1E76_28250 [Planctomycetota bacterium]